MTQTAAILDLLSRHTLTRAQVAQKLGLHYPSVQHRIMDLRKIGAIVVVYTSYKPGQSRRGHRCRRVEHLRARI